MITWHNNLPRATTIEYAFRTNSLSLHIRDGMHLEGEISLGGVYSLVDFNPGMIGVYADASDDGICRDLHFDVSRCRHSVLDPLFKSFAVTSVQIHFPYPKNIEYDAEFGGTTCKHLGRTFLVQLLPFDIDDADSLANVKEFRTAEEDRGICMDFTNAAPLQLR